MTRSATTSDQVITGPAPKPSGRGPIDPRLLRHARSSRSGLAGLALLGAGQAGATVLLAVALTLIVAGPRGHAIVLLAAAYLLRAALSGVEQILAQRTAARAADELRRATLTAALRRGPAWVARYGSGRLAAVLSNGLDSLRPWFAGYLPALILGVALPPLVIIAIALVDPASAVIALLTLPLIPVLGALIGWATQARARQRWEADTRLSGHFLDVVQGLATLRVYGRAEHQTEVVATMTDRHRGATMRVLRVAFLSSTALDLVGTLSVGLIAVEAGLRVADGSLGLGPALLVILLAPEAYRPLREVAARFHASADASAVIADIDEVLTDRPADDNPTAAPNAPAAFASVSPASFGEISPASFAGVLPASSAEVLPASSAEALPGPEATAGAARRPTAAAGERAREISPDLRPEHRTSTKPASVSTGRPASQVLDGAVGRLGQRPDVQGLAQRPDVQGLTQRPEVQVPRVGVSARGLRVRHPGTDTDALALDALTARGGEIVALRGPSGAGKTTALRALAGIQPLRAGAVELTGPRPLYLSQRPVLAHAHTVADVFEQPGDAPEGLRLVGLEAEIEPETPLGEHGAGVSAGQRQRLALAAMMIAAHREPTILLLDEPTAHLDATAEQKVIAGLRAAADRGCAVVVIAHRPALLTAADRIIDITAPAADQAAANQSSTDQATASRASTDQTAASRATAHQADGKAEALKTPAASRPASPGPPPTPRVHSIDELGQRSPVIHRPTPSGRKPARILRHPAAVIGLGAASWLAGIVLTGAAAWLLVRASTLPPVLTLSVAVVLVRGSAIARPLLRYLERLAAHDLAFGRLGERRAGVYADLIPRVPGPRQTRRGELLTRVVDDVDAMVDGLLRGRFPAAAAGVALGIVSAVAIVLLPAAGPAIAAGLLLAAVLAPAVAAHQAGRREDDTAQARAALNDAVVETIDGLEDLATGGPGALAVPERRSRALAGQESRAARSAGLAAAIGHLGWGVAVVGTALTLGGLSHEWSAVVLLALVALGEPVMSLPDTAVARRRAAGAQQRLAELTAQPPSATVNHDIDPAAAMTPQPTAQPASTMTLQQTEPTARPKTADVRIRGLVAGWDLDRPPALRGLDLDLPAGSRTAVLGPSGGGKSTLAAVLARLLDPRAGTVTLGGVDLLTLDDREVRRRIGLVSEDADHIFASTVRENLRLARTDADDEALHRVLKRVGLDLDLDRWLGTGGGTVSGGQRKRLATARALLADPELLILDEPTEGLDQAGAEALMADLLAATEGRTVLLLSHRTEGLDRIGEIHRLENHALTTADA